MNAAAFIPRQMLKCGIRCKYSSECGQFLSQLAIKKHFYSLSCQPCLQRKYGRKHYNSACNQKQVSLQRGYYKAAGLHEEHRDTVGDTLMIDLRSDTITKPTQGMREAMANAEVGDDVYGEDPTINELQERCAKLFGMEASLFVPTGTMGNLIAIMCHCEGRGLEAVVGHKSHILLNEQGGIAQFAGVTPRTIQNFPDGTFSLEELRSFLRGHNDPHHAWTKLICLENTHNFCGGKVLPMTFLKQVYELATENDLLVHVDGARVLNAATSLGVPVSEILKYSHSVNMCFSKGLAAPVGSILAGNRDFIAKALRLRKALGGGMRQAGVLAAAAMYSLDHIVPRLREDHIRAKKIAQAMMEVNNGVLNIDLDGVHSNIITVEVIKPGLTAADFCKRVGMHYEKVIFCMGILPSCVAATPKTGYAMEQSCAVIEYNDNTGVLRAQAALYNKYVNVTEGEESTLDRRAGIKMNPIYPQTARLLTHNDLSEDMINLAIEKLQYVIREFSTV